MRFELFEFFVRGAATTPPNWADGLSAWASLLSAVASVLTFLALVVGAIVGFRRFGRQRIIRSGCETAIVVREVTVNGTRALHVEVSVANSGTVMLEWVRDARVRMTVEAMEAEMWEEVRQNPTASLWGHSRIYDANLEVDSQQGLEPNARFHFTVLVPLYEYDGVGPFLVSVEAVAYPKSLVLLQKRQAWGREVVAYGGTHVG